MEILRVEHLQKVYQSRGGAAHLALDDVSFTVDAGSFVVVMGPSGSGKTTLLNLVAGLDRPTGGSVSLADHRLERLSEEERARIRRRYLGFVFQDYHLLDPLTVEENVLLPLTLERAAREPEIACVREVLARLGLADKRDRFPFELSGGEQQRVAIARAIVHRPALLLADEPTGNLDSATSRIILETLSDLHRTDGATMLVVTHDPFAASYGERILMLKDGRLYAELLRGADDRPAFYQRIIDALSTLEVAA